MGPRRLLAPLVCVAALVLAAPAAAAPVLGWVAASLQEVSGRYYVDPADSYVVEIATAPDVNADGSFVAANVVDSLQGLQASGGSLDWKADRRLAAGTYVVHSGELMSGAVAWSPTTSFTVITPCVIPDVRGRTLARARSALAARGCRVGAVRAVRSTRRAGRVVRTDPPVGTPVPPQLSVRLFVSAGPRRHAHT